MAEWYYTTNNQQMGPVSWDELRQLASTGLLHPNDMVWKEGMIDWLKAGKKDGLFSASPARGDVDESLPRRRSRERDRGDRDRRDRDDYDDDYDDRPRRRRRAASEGMPLGAKVAIIGGSIAVGLVILIVVIILVVRGSGGGAAPLGPNAYRVTLFRGQENIRLFRFNAGQPVRVTVTSQADFRTDVDLFVERGNGFPIRSDTRISKDCFVNFVAPATDTYRIRVRNLGPGVTTSDVNIQ
ncbi:MAG: DUF4339 domain-containing protein [Gemmataceae bacterium]|nr:DUF4339 domain-containing protein [Gemmataceae bacterium]